MVIVMEGSIVLLLRRSLRNSEREIFLDRVAGYLASNGTSTDFELEIN